jgi:hypothetical protein
MDGWARRHATDASGQGHVQRFPEEILRRLPELEAPGRWLFDVPNSADVVSGFSKKRRIQFRLHDFSLTITLAAHRRH